MSTTLSPAVLEQMAAMHASKRGGGTKASQPEGNRTAKILGLLSEVDTKGLYVLSAETILPGWTKVDHGQVIENVRPAEVAAMIERRSKVAVENMQAGVPQTEDNARFAQYKVLPSLSLKPSQNAKLGGRFYLVSNDEAACNEADPAEWSSMLDDIDENLSIFVSTWRTIDLIETDEDES
jgi:hypothetical protein